MEHELCDEACRDMVVAVLRLVDQVEAMKDDLEGVYESIITVAIDHRGTTLRASVGLCGPVAANLEEGDHG